MEGICRICKSGEIRFYGTTLCYQSLKNLKYLKKRSLYKCDQCKSISVDPIPDQEDLTSYYDDYSNARNGKEFFHRRNSLFVIKQLASNLGYGNVLDIGCGFGDILASLPFSFKKVGIDMASDACIEAEKKGVEVLCSTWESADLNTKFDLVIALDFLEHVNDPSGALHKIGRVLRKGGYVVIETGNADSWAAKTLGEDWCYSSIYGHLQIFSPTALVNLAKEAGIETISLIKGYQSSEKLNYILYRGMLAYGLHLLKLAFVILRLDISDHYYLSKFFNRVPPGSIFSDNMILIGRKT